MLSYVGKALCLCSLFSITNAEIIFETTFDDIPDFMSVESNDPRIVCSFNTDGDKATYINYESHPRYSPAPEGFTSYRAVPNVGSDSAKLFTIDGMHSRKGKSLKIYPGFRYSTKLKI